jgi:hypothetical protein
MLDMIYLICQILCLLGLIYGAVLAIGQSATLMALGRTRVAHRLRKVRPLREPGEPNPRSKEFRYGP